MNIEDVKQMSDTKLNVRLCVLLDGARVIID